MLFLAMTSLTSMEGKGVWGHKGGLEDPLAVDELPYISATERASD